MTQNDAKGATGLENPFVIISTPQRQVSKQTEVPTEQSSMGIFPDCASKCWLSAEKGNDIIFVPYRQETVSNCERDWTRRMVWSFGWKSGRIFTPINLLSKILIGDLGWNALSEKRIVAFIRILCLFYDSIKINDIAEK